MTAILAIASALLVGGADFTGGFLSRTVSPFRVAALAQVVGLALAVPTALLVDSERVAHGDVAWSAASGVAVGLGLVAFYSAMTRGMISLVAPVTAVTGAVVPVVYAFGSGERPGTAAVVGIVLAITAIGFVSLAPGTPPTSAGGHGALSVAFAAGILFGLFYVCFARVHEDAGMWPVAISRVTSSTVVVALALGVTGGLAVRRTVVPHIAMIGVLEVGAAVTLLRALQRGPVSVASVLASLYPVTTMFLAALVLRERLSGLQLVGVALALVAVTLISSA
jgi:drug/metabolite transporter (DMT)-like permease